MKWVGSALKAVYAGAIAGLGALAVVLVDGGGVGDVTDGQWVTIASAALVAFGGVYGVTNGKP